MNPMLPFPQKLEVKYLPRKIEDFVGIAAVKRVMTTFIRRPKPDAFLFLGSSGRGKTAMALAVIDALAAEQHHIPSKSCDLQTIESNVAQCYRVPWNMFGPNAGKPTQFHCIHVSEADKMTDAAQVALLSKTDATEWPPQTFFIFTANGTTQLEARFLSRMKVLKFDDEGMDVELPRFLESVAKREGHRGRLNYEEIAFSTNYNVRDALNKLELELMGAGYMTEKVTPIRTTSHVHSCPTHGEWEHNTTKKCTLEYKAKCMACQRKRRRA